MKNIGIIGCGWLGLHLAHFLSDQYTIYTTTTSEENKAHLMAMGYHSVAIRFSDDTLAIPKRWDSVEALDAIIITIPFSKQPPIEALQKRFQNLISFIKGFEKPIFLMSSIGIYPQIAMEITEDSFDDHLLNPNIRAIEQLITQNFPQCNILRLAGLMGADRKLSRYRVSNPEQRVNHIHYEDICNIIASMLTQNIQGEIFNIVAPQHPIKQEIINFQKGMQEPIPFSESNRIISSEKLCKTLQYKFKHPNPIYF